MELTRSSSQRTAAQGMGRPPEGGRHSAGERTRSIERGSRTSGLCGGGSESWNLGDGTGAGPRRNPLFRACRKKDPYWTTRSPERYECRISQFHDCIYGRRFGGRWGVIFDMRVRGPPPGGSSGPGEGLGMASG